MVSLSTRPKGDSRFLHSVVSEVRELLEQGTRVFLCASDNAYRMPIYGIRITRNTKLLQVKTCFGWSTVWSSEQLTDAYGGCLYKSMNYYELRKELEAEAFDAFTSSIGLLKPEFNIKDVF